MCESGMTFSTTAFLLKINTYFVRWTGNEFLSFRKSRWFFNRKFSLKATLVFFKSTVRNSSNQQLNCSLESNVFSENSLNLYWYEETIKFLSFSVVPFSTTFFKTVKQYLKITQYVPYRFIYLEALALQFSFRCE